MDFYSRVVLIENWRGKQFVIYRRIKSEILANEEKKNRCQQCMCDNMKSKFMSNVLILYMISIFHVKMWHCLTSVVWKSSYFHRCCCLEIIGSDIKRLLNKHTTGYWSMAVNGRGSTMKVVSRLIKCGYHEEELFSLHASHTWIFCTKQNNDASAKVKTRTLHFSFVVRFVSTNQIEMCAIRKFKIHINVAHTPRQNLDCSSKLLLFCRVLLNFRCKFLFLFEIIAYQDNFSTLCNHCAESKLSFHNSVINIVIYYYYSVRFKSEEKKKKKKKEK